MHPHLAHRAIAIVTENLNYETSYQPVTGPGGASFSSLIPRGIRRFFLQTDVADKPLNDEINVFITATLPENFAYMMTRFSAQLLGDTVTEYNTEFGLRMFNHIPGQPVGVSEEVTCQSTPFFGTGNDRLTARGAKDAIAMFTGPVWAVHGGSVTFRLQLTNVGAPACVSTFLITHAEFLVFDLTQAQRYWINTLIPVLSR